MSNLMLHCGANHISREELQNLPIPAPKGPRHHPMSFYTFTDMVEEQLDRRGLDVVDTAFGVTPDHNRFFGLLEFEHKHSDYAVMVGLRASHDQSMARGVALGSRVFVCDNLSFHGEYMVRTMQTTHIEKRLPGLVSQAVAKLPGEVERQEALLEQLKEMDVSGTLAEGMMVELVRREIVPPSRLGPIIKTWDNECGKDDDYEPKYLVDGHPTGWTLYNSITEAMRPSDRHGNVPVNIDKTLDLTALFEDELAA